MRAVLIVVVIVLLVLVGVIAYLNLTGVEVVVTNAGANPVPVRGRLPNGAEPLLAALGVRGLPDELRPGAPVSLRLPAVSGEVNATAPGAIVVTALGQTVRFDAMCDSLTLNGTSLLGRQTTVNLGERARHEVQFACR
jgi:hypothetical protein